MFSHGKQPAHSVPIARMLPPLPPLPPAHFPRAPTSNSSAFASEQTVSHCSRLRIPFYRTLCSLFHCWETESVESTRLSRQQGNVDRACFREEKSRYSSSGECAESTRESMCQALLRNAAGRRPGCSQVGSPHHLGVLWAQDINTLLSDGSARPLRGHERLTTHLFLKKNLNA